MKKILALLLVVVLLVGLVACSTPDKGTPDKPKETKADAPDGTEADTPDDEPGTDETPEPAGKKIYRYALAADPETFDPCLAHGIPSATICYHIYGSLYIDDVGNIRPALAESYELAEDQVTYTFKLRDGLLWSDGEPLTAHDFEYGIKRFIDPDTASPMGYFAGILKNGQQVIKGELPLEELGVRAIDEKTLEIVLEYPAGYFLGMLSKSFFSPQRQDIVEQYGKDYCATPDKQVYSGAFVVTEFGEGKMVLTKNPNYFEADKVKLDGVEIYTVAEANTQLSMFENGELDMVVLSTEIAPQYEGQSLSYFDGANDFGGPNLRNKYLANKDFRLALNYAINREEYILLGHNGLYTPNLRYVLPQVSGVEKSYGEEYPYEAFPLQGDVEKAKQHLDAAMAELGVADPSEITLKMVTTDAETAKKEAEILQHQSDASAGTGAGGRTVDLSVREDANILRCYFLVPVFELVHEDCAVNTVQAGLFRVNYIIFIDHFVLDFHALIN
jgi:oligopeptide transport system substrate-binding protein